MPATSESPPAAGVPSVDEIRCKTSDSLGRVPCLWQCEVARMILEGTRDVVCVSGTGSGKTLTFWMPLLFRPGGIQVIITPLNILGAQTKQQLDSLGISAIAIRGETATQQNIEDIISLRYRVVAVSPEVALKPRGVFERVWRSQQFVAHLISVELGEVYLLRNVLTSNIPYLLPSATLPENVLHDVLDMARVRKHDVHLIRRSNDRPNVYLTVRMIRYALSSYKDLEFLAKEILRAREARRKLRKFLVFFDNIEQSIQACKTFRLWLGLDDRERVVWFNADNTAHFREKVTAQFQSGELIGLFCTDAFGMGIDIPDIELIVQWRPTCDLNALWQRFGRGARDPGKEAH
ncbi:P-loop containing nucleoside triphosphate hydrolase protein [Trametes sanguinea]|nr:P-loop containing nucleoside triphosphate hydrolase protein [Trametes sanguinea]